MPTRSSGVTLQRADAGQEPSCRLRETADVDAGPPARLGHDGHSRRLAIGMRRAAA